MIENSIKIQTRDGRMDAYYAHPDEPGDYPAVIMFMDAPGIRQELRDFAKRIAASGYLCLLPDMYYRVGTMRFRLSHRDAAMSSVIAACRASLTNELVMEDTRAMLQWMDGHKRVRPGKKGVIGYCMCGGYVFAAMGTFPDRLAAGASICGLEIITDKPDSPHLLADKIKGEMYFCFAEHDRVPRSWFTDIPAMLDKHGVKNRLEVYPDARHACCFPERQVYDAYVAERSWGQVFNLFHDQLQR